MAIFRGIGGAGDSTTDATVTAVTEQATNAANSATAAASSASSASSSASAASTSASNASSSASSASTSAANAATSASNASSSASSASTSATNAAASETAAGASETAAAASESAAATSASNAASSASSASSSASTATTKASEASASASTASTSASNAATSASNAAASESAASTSETNAATSETNAANSASAASSSASSASSSASAASTSASNAAASETAAAASETAAGVSETNAAASASTASTAATTATTQAGNAATSASNAATSETNAASSASSAASSASSASASADAALAALDNFDDRYLGQKASDPSVDNDGNALVAGALYFNTTDNVMKVYEGSSWVAAYASLSGALLAANNLSDVSSVSSARTNLGLGTGDSPTLTGLTLSGGTANGVTYLNGSKVLTSGSGLTFNGSTLDVTGTVVADGLTVDGDVAISSTNSRLRLFETDTTDLNTQLQNSAGDFNISTLADDAASSTLRLKLDHATGDISFYEDTGTTAKLTWDASAESLNFADNAKAIFGAGSDLQIYHNGSHSTIEDVGTGNLQIHATDFRLRNSAGTESMILANADGNVQLYYDNALKLATTSTGINVTGDVVADGLTVDGVAEINASTSAMLSFEHSISTNPWTLGADSTGNFRVRENGTDRAYFLSGGDFQLFEDTGTTPKFFWDASAESLGIGTSSPSAKLHIASSGSPENLELKFDTGVGATGSNFVDFNHSRSAGNFTFSFAGSECLRITSAGSVGIGTSSPGKLLDLDSNVGLALRFLNSGTFKAGIEVATSSGQMVSSSAVDDLAIRGQTNILFSSGGATERMRIDSSGKVSIGTSSPAAQLHINRGSDGNIIQANGANLTWDFILKGTNGSTSNEVLYEMGMYRGDGTTDPNTVLKFGRGGSIQNGFFAIDQNGTEALRIDSTGNVGIGTSSPGSKLQVNSDSSGAVSTCIQVINNETTAGSGAQISITSRVGGTNANAILRNVASSSGNANLIFDVESAGSATERMRITSAGNVGIGTTSPSSKLQISNSTAVDTQFQISNSLSTLKLSSFSDGTGAVETTGNYALRFFTNSTERMRIDSSGNLKFDSGYGSVATAYGCRAWVNFNGTGTVAIKASGNVSSITDNGTGDHTVNFATAMPDNDYAASATCVARSNGSGTLQGIGYHSTDNSTASTYSTTAVRLIVKRSDGATLVDVDTISVIIFR